ncbi:MAG: hypothetical protein ACTII7_09785 [Galactobacter sp.]
MSTPTTELVWPQDFGSICHQDVTLLDEETLQLATHVYGTTWTSPDADHLIILTYREGIPTDTSSGIHSCSDITTPVPHGLHSVEVEKPLLAFTNHAEDATSLLEQLYSELEDEYEFGGLGACRDLLSRR